MIKTQENLFNKIFTSHFIARVRKGLLKVCVWEGAGDHTETVIFWPHCYDRQRCVFLVLLMLGSILLGAGFLYCILSATSLVPKVHRGSWGPLRPCVAFLTTSRPSPSPTLLQLAVELNWNRNSIAVLTEQYNSSTPTWSPTRSLKSHV